jgi:uncharacterized membrane protein YvbJ
MICKQCGTTIADKAIVCYRCGTATTDPVRKPLGDQSLTGAPSVRPMRSGWPSLAALVILLLLALYAGLTPERGVPPVIAGLVAGGAAVLFLLRLLRRKRP